MPFPINEQPRNKHDLVGVRALIKSVHNESTLMAHECQFHGTTELLDSLNRGVNPQDLRLLCPVYSYADAPQEPEPLSRALIMIGVAGASLSSIQTLIATTEKPSWLHECTLAVKLIADADHATRLPEQDVANSRVFCKFMRMLRKSNSVAILGNDKHGRFGILVPLSIEENGNSSYITADEFAATCFVGSVRDLKRHFETLQESNPSTVTTTSLWQPPGTSENGDVNGNATTGDGSGGLWQPPDGADAMDSSDFGDGAESNTGFDAWVPSTNSNTIHQLAGTKRKAQEFHADEGAAAADAFYSGLKRNLDTRADSMLFHMRSFNGWVKATQIQELNPKVKGQKARAPLRVLDLACGKGGDLGKWVLHQRGVQNYVGVDVARGSLRDAAMRARKMKKLPKCTFTCADLGADVPGRLRSTKSEKLQKLLSWSRQDESEFETNEPVFKMVRGGGILPSDKFDVVSIQFAIHYMMSSRKRARRFFQTVSELLEIGGNLIVTTIDARVVLEHMMGLGLNLHFDDSGRTNNKEQEGALVKVGGGACRLQFDADTVKKLFSRNAKTVEDDNLYGLQYTFTLVEGSDHAAGVGDAVNLPEWLTPIPVLESLAAEAGLELESAENFHEFYNKRRDASIYGAAHAALYNMKVLNRNGSISPDEWEVSRLYAALKFRKVGESKMTFDDATDEENDNGDDSDQEMQSNDEEKKPSTVPPALKSKLMPMAMMKAKKAYGEAWKDLSSEEKTRFTQIELEKLAGVSKEQSDSSASHVNDTDATSVAIIVPFRDLHESQQRARHLQRFLPHMHEFLGNLVHEKKISNYHIYIVEQSDDGRKFNRGKLLNIGFDVAQKSACKHNVFIFHDVDLLPQKDLGDWYAAFPTAPIHIARVWDRYSNNEKYFGGVVSFSSSDYKRINGYPNTFWGWGGEDDEMQERLENLHIKWTWPNEGTLVDLEEMTLTEKLDFLRSNKEWKCQMKWEALKEHEATWKTNGLADLKYTLLETTLLDGTQKASKVICDVELNGNQWDSTSSVDYRNG